jgi:uncharacterized protein YjbI with pentapeptide repeats
LWARTGFGDKTLWDLLQLLVVPLVLVGIGLLFELQQAEREARRSEAEQYLAEQRAQDEALQAYLDQMSQLILDRKLLEAEPGTPVHTLAQARTSTAILRLDAEHNESVTRFLIESKLAVRSEASARLLSEITLSHDATLSQAFLPLADLRDADLSGVELSGANLINADLSGADLSNANLVWTNLKHADLSHADLSDANLYEADLSEADLSGAKLSDAILINADLSGANLRDARGVTEEQLEELEEQAQTLEGATMPDGSEHP